jgi:hypothetical protein
MAILITNDGDKIVNTIADRNAITRKFDGMQVTVRNALSDPMVGSVSEAIYVWNATQSRWMLTWKENVDNLTFVTEQLLIMNGQVTATNYPQNGLVWGATVQSTLSGEAIILYDVRPSVDGKILDLGVTDYDGNMLEFTYGYGVIQAAISAINAGIDANDNSLVTGAPTNMVGFVVGDGLNLIARPLVTADISDYTAGSVTPTDLALKADLASPTFTGTVSGITKSMVGLGSVDNTSDTSKPVSTATQTALDLKADSSSVYTKTETDSAIQAVVGAAPAALDTLVEIATQLASDESAASALTTAVSLKAPLASPTFTGTVSGITKSMVGLGNVDNTSDSSKPVSTATQTALDAKAPLASPTFTGTVSGITKSMVGLGSVDNTSDTAKPISTATQTALDAKAPLASPTFTGTVSGITATMVGLSNVDNTADTAKPISTATQTALDLKAPLTSAALVTPTVTGLKEKKVAMAANAIDLATGNFFTKTIIALTTFTVSNVPAAGTANSFILDLTNGGAFTITWWAGVKWAAGTAPVLTASGRDLLGFFTHDGGTTWNGLVLSKDMK